MESKVILYHSNEKEKCALFLKGEQLILSKNSKDDRWLGNGMYFWDNMGNACWWRKNQLKKNSASEYMIVAANVKLDEMLDLTDPEVYVSMERLWKQLCKKIKRNSDIPLGSKLNFLFVDKGFCNMYALVKVYGKYNKTPDNGLFKFDCASTSAEPTIAVKCIYGIKDNRCIVERELVKEENNE